MKIAIVGSRDWGLKEQKAKDTLYQIFLSLNSEDIVISGGARGIDTWARIYAKNRNVKIIEYLPNYEMHGINAPLIRNKQIGDECDKMYCIWNGISRGSQHVTNYAKSINKEVIIMEIK